MLTLYYSPGACSMAPHIALEEAGVSYTPQLVSIPKGEHLADAPAECESARQGAGASHRARHIDRECRHSDLYRPLVSRANLLPEEPIEMARCLAHMAYLSNTVHPAFTHILRPGRFATKEGAHENLKATGRANARKLLQELDAILAGKEWVLGSRYSVADPYTLVIYGWGRHHRLGIEQLTHYTAFKDRMLQRPAVRTVLAREQSALWHD